MAILTTAQFDAADVNASTLTLEGSAAREKGNSGNFSVLEDVDGDSDLDLVVEFPTQGLQLSAEDTAAVLEGFLFDGTAIRGSDAVVVLP